MYDGTVGAVYAVWGGLIPYVGGDGWYDCRVDECRVNSALSLLVTCSC